MVNFEGLVITEKYLSIPGLTSNNIRYNENLSLFSGPSLLDISEQTEYYAEFFDFLAKSVSKYRYSKIVPDVFFSYTSYNCKLH